MNPVTFLLSKITTAEQADPFELPKRHLSKKPSLNLYRVRRLSDDCFEEGIYITCDGRFQIARGDDKDRWWLSSAWMVTIDGEGNDGPISDQQFDDEQLLSSLGLDKVTFQSRKAAVDALRVSVYDGVKV